MNFISIVYHESFQINRSAYESLKNGGFEKLSSKELKAELSRYYDLNAISRSKAIALSNDGQQKALGDYVWEKSKTYVGEQDYEKKCLISLLTEDST